MKVSGNLLSRFSFTCVSPFMDSSNFAIAVVSKQRLFKETFRLLQVVKNIPIYVYVDAREAAAYHEAHPRHIIIPHSYTSIHDIRAYVQKHQYELGNDFLFLDDDIVYFCGDQDYPIPFNFVVDQVREKLSTYDFISFPLIVTADKAAKNPIKTKAYMSKGHAATAVALSTKLYEAGVVYRDDGCFEDLGFHLNVVLAGRPFISLENIWCVISFAQESSNFKTAWRYYRALETYYKYGDVVYVSILPGCNVTVGVRSEGLDAYIKAGMPVYENTATKFSIVQLPYYPGVLNMLKPETVDGLVRLGLMYR